MKYDAVVVGSGPNGLSAAISLVRAGYSVLLIEGHKTPGGGVRSAELTLPGFIHDSCSAVYPMAVGSPFFRSLPLSDFGLRWIDPPLPLAHPLPDGRAVLMEKSVDATAKALGRDGDRYRNVMKPFVEQADDLVSDLLRPLRLPRHWFLALRFGWFALRPARFLASSFATKELQALWAGLAAHTVLPFYKLASSAVPLMLGMAGRAYGWPIVQGGAQNLTSALLDYYRSIGGELILGRRVRSVEDIPAAKVVLFDGSPRTIAEIEGIALSQSLKKRLLRYRHGPAAFKIDWALDRPIPWTAEACLRAGTVHLGGSFEEIAESEAAAFEGRPCEKPFVLLAQPSLFDPTRAPSGKHTAWAYCHLPNGSEADYTEAIESQIERYAPGFRSCILARNIMGPRDLETYNPNYIGGDIVGGAADIWQLFTRPLARWDPYHLQGLYFICSASSPPGAGVHGLCGYHAAQSAIKRLRRRK